MKPDSALRYVERSLPLLLEPNDDFSAAIADDGREEEDGRGTARAGMATTTGLSS